MLAEPVAQTATISSPSVSVEWQDIKIPNGVSGTKPLDVQNKKWGPLEFELSGAASPTFTYSLSDFTIHAGKLQVAAAHGEVQFPEIKGKNVKLPQITARTKMVQVGFVKTNVPDGFETTFKEVTLLDRPAVDIEKDPNGELSLVLPPVIKLEIRRDEDNSTHVKILNSEEVISALKGSVDTSFSNESLNAGLTFGFRNVPSLLEPSMVEKLREESKGLFQKVRTDLKKELDSPDFMKKIEEGLEKQLPALALNPGERLVGQLTLSADGKKLSHLVLSESGASNVPLTDDQRNEIVVTTNQAALDLLMRSFMGKLLSDENGSVAREVGDSLKVDPKSGLLSTRLKPKRSEPRSLAF